MNILVILITAAAIVFYLLYEERRKPLRVPIMALLALNAVIYFSPHVRCAVNMSPRSYLTFDWKVISFQYDFCILSDSVKENLGIDL
jgi:hypothetical protein